MQRENQVECSRETLKCKSKRSHKVARIYNTLKRWLEGNRIGHFSQATGNFLAILKSIFYVKISVKYRNYSIVTILNQSKLKKWNLICIWDQTSNQSSACCLLHGGIFLHLLFNTADGGDMFFLNIGLSAPSCNYDISQETVHFITTAATNCLLSTYVRHASN
jgi:hypothetical protein